MRTRDEIVDLYFDRRNRNANAKNRMRDLRDHYNGDVIVPLPEIDQAEQAAVANLLAQGMDQTAMRINSVLPDIICPPTDDTSQKARKYAAIRRRAMFGWWQNSKLDLQLAKRSRHLIGYSQTVTKLRFDTESGVPVWAVRDPLTAFPSNLHGVEDMRPVDCVFGYERGLGWLHGRYPEAATRFMKVARDMRDHDARIEMIEYVDADEHVLVALSDPASSTQWGAAPSGPTVVELERTPNRAGVCPVVVASRVSLDDARGQFDGILGMFQQQAKLMALEVIAVQKGIFPDTWLVGNQGEQPKIINVANGLTGEVGVIRGGTLKDMQLQPGFMTNPAIDRLERGQRLSAGIPAEFGGESTSNIRTGRRGDAVLSAVVDFTVQEAQKITARALEEENRVAVALAKAYAPNRSKSFYVQFGGTRGKTDYTPSQHFTTDNNIVSYSQAGSDINNLVIAGGQRVQMGTMPKRKFMEIDPLIDDPEAASDLIVAEQLEAALLSGLQQQAQAGQLPPADLARIMELVRNDKKDLAGAVEQAHKEAQERQSKQAPPTSPEAQPGIGNPGAGAGAAPAGPQPAGGGSGLRQMLAAISGGGGVNAA